VGAETLERRNQNISKQDIVLKTKDQLDVHCYFYFTSYALNMFRTLIYPSSGAYIYSVELPHWSCILGSMCVGVSVWFVFSYYNDALSNKYKTLMYLRIPEFVFLFSDHLIPFMLFAFE